MNTLTVNPVDSLKAWEKVKKTVNAKVSADYMAISSIVQDMNALNYQLEQLGSGIDTSYLNLPRFSDILDLDRDQVFGQAFRSLLPVKHLEDKVSLCVIITPLSYDRIEVVGYWTR